MTEPFICDEHREWEIVPGSIGLQIFVFLSVNWRSQYFTKILGSKTHVLLSYQLMLSIVFENLRFENSQSTLWIRNFAISIERMFWFLLPLSLYFWFMTEFLIIWIEPPRIKYQTPWISSSVEYALYTYIQDDQLDELLQAQTVCVLVLQVRLYETFALQTKQISSFDSL